MPAETSLLQALQDLGATAAGPLGRLLTAELAYAQLAGDVARASPAVRRGWQARTDLAEISATLGMAAEPVSVEELALLAAERRGGVLRGAVALELLDVVRRAGRYRLGDLVSPRAAVLLRLSAGGRHVALPHLASHPALIAGLAEILTPAFRQEIATLRPALATLSITATIGGIADTWAPAIARLYGAAWLAGTSIPGRRPLRQLGPRLALSEGLLGRDAPAWSPDRGTPWIPAGLTMLQRAAERGLGRLAALQAAEVRARAWLVGRDPRGLEHQVLDVLLARPVVTAAGAATDLGASARGVTKAMVRMDEAGLVGETTGRAGWRAWSLNITRPGSRNESAPTLHLLQRTVFRQ